MARYRVDLTRTAAKQLDELPGRDRRRVVAKIDALAQDPRPHGVEKLAGEEAAYRVRVGDYRIVYEIHDDVLRVIVIRIGHRREVYR